MGWIDFDFFIKRLDRMKAIPAKLRKEAEDKFFTSNSGYLMALDDVEKEMNKHWSEE